MWMQLLLASPKDPTSVQEQDSLLQSVEIMKYGNLNFKLASKYIALLTAMQSLIHLQNIHHEVVDALKLLKNKDSWILTIYKDNQASIILATMDPPRHMPQSQTIGVKYQLKKGFFHLEKIDGNLQCANIF